LEEIPTRTLEEDTDETVEIALKGKYLFFCSSERPNKICKKTLSRN
jgi:hypothetical protein